MPHVPQPQTPDASGEPYLAAEQFDVYRIALEFQALTAGLVPRGRSDLRNQLDRASASILLNLSEGTGRRHAADKAHFYAIARGSSMESGAILDVLRIRRLAADADCRRGRALLIRVVQMLTRLEASMLARLPHR
jgi:four helix bundle protein